MGWNEPPGGNKGKDPWGNRGNNEGPPDLDEIVKKMQKGLGGLFGRRGGGGRNGGGGPALVSLLVIIIGIGWLLTDITYFIDQQERGVVMRFGEYVRTMSPGLNVAYPSFVDSVERVNVGQIRSFNHRASMLTQDENIVDVEVAVQWQIADPHMYLFNVVSPALTLRQVAESAIRSVIGRSRLDFVLTEGRSEIAQRQHELIQQILDNYEAGILVVGVEMQPARPPEQVKDAFDEAIRAREDEQRLINEAEAYRAGILPQARGEAARITEEANGYKARVIAGAEGEASRFEQLLAEYEQAPTVTRNRMYLESIESVLSNSGKILIDSESSNSLMYLPIDRLMEEGRRGRVYTSPQSYGSATAGSGSGGSGNSNSDSSRSRGSR